jgi:hypothetical protein
MENLSENHFFFAKVGISIGSTYFLQIALSYFFRKPASALQKR